MKSRLSRIHRSLREVGFFYTMQTTVKNLFPTRVLGWGSFLIFELDARNWSGSQWSEEGIRQVRAEDAPQLARTKALPLTLDRYLNRGSRMCVAEVDDRIVGFYIYDARSVEHLGWLRIDLSDDVLWTSDTWVAPECRGNDLLSRMRSFNLSRLVGDGYQRCMSFVELQNMPSLRASLKNVNVVCTVTYFRVFRFTLVWMDGRLHAGYWSPDRRLVISSDHLHSVPGQKFGRYKARKLERHVYGRAS